jgi:hypothetical protein
MKRLIAIAILLSICTFTVNAQDEPKPGGISFGKSDRLLLNFHDDLWQGNDSAMNISAYSPGFDFYVMKNLALGKSKFALAIGLGIGTHNLRSDAMPANETTFDSTSGHYVPTGNTIFERIPDYVNNKEIKYDINKLALAYLDIPLELRFKTENAKGKAFKISAGFKLGYLINGHTKYRGNDLAGGTDDVKFKTFKIKNLEPLRYGAIVRFGYSYFNLFAYYSLSNVFKTDKGPEMYPISVGLCITPF